MKKRLSNSDKISETESDDVRGLIAEYRAKDAAGLIEYPKRSIQEVDSWREAWIFIFHAAHLEHSDYLKSDDGKVRCVVWSVKEFNDELVGILERVADRIGPNNDLLEIRLIETGVTSAGIEKLKKILPNSAIKLFSQEQAKKDQRIKYVNTDIEWIRRLYI